MLTATLYDHQVQLHESLNEEIVKNHEPNFFKTKHGKRETYTYHKGALIVSNTVQFTNCKPERRHTIYIMIEVDGKSHLQHVQTYVNKNAAKARINNIYKTKIIE